MAYDLGIDVGTSFTAAAVRRNQLVEVVGLGPIADNVPSVVYVDRDGRTIVGDAANRRGLTDPTAVARDFKRRLGDPTPLIVGGVPFSAESLTARVLEWVVARVTEREREPPRSIAATFPANWGPYKQELFGQALRLASLEHTTTITEPHAAALDYASRLRVPPGAVLAVYDLGGGTFDAALLRKETDRFELLAEEGVEHLGGVDFDSAIVSYVLSSAGLRWSGDASEDPSLLPALTSLRRACVEAKELLSSETEATVSVFVPGVETAVRVARSQFEGMIRDRLTETITAIRAAIARAGLTPADVSAFLLVGGSSRIPLVAQMVRAEFGRPLATDLDPMYAVARGAAIAAGQFAERTGLAEPPPARQEPARHDPGRHEPARPTMAGLPAVGRESYGMRPEAPPIGGPPPRLTPSPMTRPPGLQPQAPPLAAAPAAPPTAAPPTPAPTPAARPFDPGETVAFDRAATPPGAGPPTGQTPLLTPEPLPAGGKPRRRAPLLAAVGALLAVVLGGGAYALLNRQDDGEEAAPAAPAAAPTGATASPVDMVQAPAGAYPLGIDNPDLAESPLRTQQVKAPYWIDRTEVRNDQYAQFVAAGAAPPLGWVNGRPPATPNSGEPDHPVQGVSFAWAQAYCQALGKRLPTEAEWEIAARGGTKNLWPWGDKVDDVALPRDGSYAVGSIEGNKSAFGVYDTVGNVWEWVDMTYDQRVPADKKVLRGGQNGYLRRTMNRLPADPNLESALRGAGFRCAADGVDPAAAALQFGPFDKPAVAEPNKPPAPPPGVLLADDFTDPRSGWVEVRKETWRYGYHPNEYFHLEATAPRTAVPAPSFARYERSRNLVVSTTAFVEQNLTAPEGGFEFGLMTGAVEDKSYLAFTVNPRKQTWQVFTRQADGSRATITEGRYNVPEIVALEIANDGDSFEFRIGSEGTRLTAVAAKTVPGLTGDGVGFYLETAEAPKAHVHYRGFVVKENSK